MRTTRMSLALAAAMAVGGVGTSALFAEGMAPRDTSRAEKRDDARTEKLPALNLPPGAKAVENVKAEDMRDTVAEVTEAAMTKGGFDDLIERFVDQDRNRLGETKLTDDQQRQLDGRIEQLRKAFEAKYDQDFDIDDVNKVLANARAVEGEITDVVAFAAAWPMAVNPASPDARTAGDVVPANPDVRADQANIEKGREIGVLRYAGGHELPALDISLIDEAGGWKIDLPNTRTTGELYADMLTHLTYLGDHASQWPTDVNDAYRLFAHHVLMGIYGVDMPAQKG